MRILRQRWRWQATAEDAEPEAEARLRSSQSRELVRLTLVDLWFGDRDPDPFRAPLSPDRQ